jgi:histidinol-phosphate phosphatase family protein
MNKAIFIDKDGTLIEDIPYNINPDVIKLQAGAARCLKELAHHGFIFVIVSNQSGLARGYFSQEELQIALWKIKELLQEKGVVIAGTYFCPHLPESIPACECRKPKPGMIFQAAQELNIYLPGSWMIGDILDDIEAGNRAGCRSILINNGNETQWLTGQNRTPTFKVNGWDEISAKVLT